MEFYKMKILKNGEKSVWDKIMQLFIERFKLNPQEFQSRSFEL